MMSVINLCRVIPTFTRAKQSRSRHHRRTEWLCVEKRCRKSPSAYSNPQKNLWKEEGLQELKSTVSDMAVIYFMGLVHGVWEGRECNWPRIAPEFSSEFTPKLWPMPRKTLGVWNKFIISSNSRTIAAIAFSPKNMPIVSGDDIGVLCLNIYGGI